MNEQSGSANRSVGSNLNFFIIAVLFLFSGMSSLIYQVIWTRLLVFVFGSTTFATSTVLAVFMGGLALGSYFAGKRADKLRNPFLWYGILEGIIGFWALIAPFLFAAAIPLYKACFEQLHLQIILFGLLRFVVAAFILLPPTACMGATLPLLSRFVTRSLDTVADRVGTLYAINTLGAVVGAVAGGFVLLPSFGLNYTTIIAAAVNFLLAGGVYLLSKAWKTDSAEIDTSSEPAAESADQKLPVMVLATMIGFSISGALAMIYEVAWTRCLLMVIGSTTYAFTVMLSAFLIGIFGGSIIGSKFVDKLKSPIIWFAFCEITLCLTGLLSMILFNYLPYVNLAAVSVVGKNEWLNMIFRFCGAGVVLIPVTFVLGLIFPIAVKVCARDLQRIGSSIGKLYSMNTIGAIVGAFLAGFVVIPYLGTEESLIVASVANLLLGVLFLLLFSDLRKLIKVFSAVACVALIYWASTGPQIWDYNTITLAQAERRNYMYDAQTLPSYPEWVKTLVANNKLLFYKEGICANVAIYLTSGVTSLLTNGHVDASDTTDMENQAMLAAYPLLLKPNAKDVCVVGWGSGVTAGYALRFPIEKLTCAEIEPVVIDSSVFFKKVNYSPQNDKRLIIEPSDGRNFLLGTSKKYDAIISEPSNPWQAGVCNLFTKEYFQVCRDSLNPTGIFTFWTQTNEIPTKNLKQVFASLERVFPKNVFIFQTGSGDVTALASKEPIRFNLAELKKTLERPDVQSTVAKFNLKTAEDFLARVDVCPAGLEGLVQGASLNSDDTNHLEYEVSKSYENRTYIKENVDWLLKNTGPVWDYIDWGGMTAEEKAAELGKIARASMRRSIDRSIMWASESMRVHPNAQAQSLIAEAYILERNFEAAEKAIAEGKKLFPTDAKFVGLSGVIALRHADYLKARQDFADALKLDASEYSFRYYLALTYSPLDLGEINGIYVPPPDLDPAKVLELCKESVQDKVFVDSRPGVVLVYADALRTLGQNEQALATLHDFVKSKPNGYLSWRILGETYAAMKDSKRALFCMNRSFNLVAPDLPNFLKKARDAMGKGNEIEAVRQLQLALEMSPAHPDTIYLLADYAKHSPKAAKFFSTVMLDPFAAKK